MALVVANPLYLVVVNVHLRLCTETVVVFVNVVVVVVVLALVVVNVIFVSLLVVTHTDIHLRLHKWVGGVVCNVIFVINATLIEVEVRLCCH